jgi:hypothetical protein
LQRLSRRLDDGFPSPFSPWVQAGRADGPQAAGAVGPGGGEKCGRSWIDPNKTCRKTGGTAAETGKEWLDENVKSRYPDRTRTKIEVIGVIELSEPVEVPGSEFADVTARYGVELKKYTNASEEFRKKMGDAIGVDLSGSDQWDLAFDTGLGDAALSYAKAARMPKDVGAKLATAIRIEVNQMISQMEDNTVLTCMPYAQDGLGGKRRRLYERAGFYTYSDTGAMAALVRGGRIVKPAELGISRKDAADEIDLERLVYELLTMGRPARLDTVVAQLDAITERLQGAAA